jgi:aminopeptidase
MRSPYLDKLAKVLVHYSCGIQPGQLVQLQSDPVAMPLLEAVYEELIRSGAHVDIRVMPQIFQEIFFANASEEQLKFVSPITKHSMETIDARIAFWAETNTKAMTRVDLNRLATASSARREISSIFMNRAASGDLNWVGTLFPTASSAQDAEMGLLEYEEFVYKAGYLDRDDPVACWKQIDACQQKAVDYLNGKKTLKFKAANGTDLEVDVDGMHWKNCSGKCNFPDGEVFTGPNLKGPSGGVNGIVRFSFPAVHNGQEVEDVELTFEKGAVVDLKASKNEAFLRAMVEQDEGAKFVGEIAIGTNFQITDYTKNTLFDEKIGGTFHLAIGAGYPETGNTNESGLHWDMVCDLRKGGTIEADGEVILKDGVFTHDGWPSADLELSR